MKFTPDERARYEIGYAQGKRIAAATLSGEAEHQLIIQQRKLVDLLLRRNATTREKLSFVLGRALGVAAKAQPNIRKAMRAEAKTYVRAFRYLPRDGAKARVEKEMYKDGKMPSAASQQKTVPEPVHAIPSGSSLRSNPFTAQDYKLHGSPDGITMPRADTYGRSVIPLPPSGYVPGYASIMGSESARTHFLDRFIERFRETSRIDEHPDSSVSCNP